MDTASALKNLKISEVLVVFLIFFCTLVIFSLDVFVKANISFYIFYFPYIAVMAWRFGKYASWPMVILCFVLWFLKQWDMGQAELKVSMVWNGMICLASFCAICWMTLALRDREENLKKRSQELEQFALHAAHELQSPTTNILGYAQLLDERFQNSSDLETKDIAENIQKNVNRMTTMITELLDYARVGNRDLPVSLVDLEKIVKETLETFSFEIAEKKATIVVDPLPCLAVQPGLIGLLFQNLIGNALKYCEQEPRIHIAAVRKGKEWLFSVRDNGIGIPKEAQKRIFLMFEKLPTSKKYPGTGIGLATCQKIIERYHGRLWVESPPQNSAESGHRPKTAEPAKGSIFYFTLPAIPKTVTTATKKETTLPNH
ncbi:MAG TPA: ATP-binding protein [Candidatus Omnitrophota bacterium]|nr:ATP-binding protein [Candidatus Omnitrophota bacterium]